MKQIGKLSASACQRLLSSAQISNSSNLILEELGTILKIKKFKYKAKIKSLIFRDSIYVTINEERFVAIVSEEENPDDDYKFMSVPSDVQQLTLSDIRSFPRFDDKYVIPSTIQTHPCSVSEPCPICDSGKCNVCHGAKTVICNACNGSTKCPTCRGKGQIACFSCNQSGRCWHCEGSGEECCDVCDGDGWIWIYCRACGGTGEYPCYSCNQSGQCRHCNGLGKKRCDDCDGEGWEWNECRDCNGTGRYTLRNGREVDCRTCHGRGRFYRAFSPCETCEGTGSVNCHACDGSGYCSKCSGHGHVECRVCNGSGVHHKENCSACNSKGSIDCHICDGSGNCQECSGSGHVKCRKCHGDGLCQKCNGTGNLKCTRCNGSGLCSLCKGTHAILCHRCSGTGIYQTFKSIALEENTRSLILKDKSVDRLLEADSSSFGKRLLYKGTPYILDFGKTLINDTSMIDFLNNFHNSTFWNKMLEYRNSILNSDGSSKLGNDTYLKALVTVEHIPIIKGVFEYSNKNFIFYTVGTDGKVFTDKTPSLWDKICVFFH